MPLISMLKISSLMDSSARAIQIAVEYDSFDNGGSKSIEKWSKS